MRPVELPEYDPQRYLEYRVNHRLGLWIRSAIFVPAGLAFAGLFVWASMDMVIVAMVVLGICAIAVGSEAISTVRDLLATPVVTRGRVGRSWKKARLLFFGRVDYVMVRRKLFEISAITAIELQPGDEVEVLHWPHTNSIITLERVARVEELEP